MRSATLGFVIATAFVGVIAMSLVVAAPRTDANTKANVAGHAARAAPPPQADSDAQVRMEPPVPIRVGAKVHRITVTKGADGASVVVPRTVAGDTISCEDSDNAVYCNTLGNMVFGPSGSTSLGRIADDIVTVALSPIGDLNLSCCGQFCCDPEDEKCCRHCDLDRFKIRVTGDISQDPDCVGEEYTVTFGLYPTCPGANRDAIPVAGTEMEVPIPAAQACDIVEVERLIPSFSSIKLPNQLYLGVKFSRPGCAWVVGAPATVGFSADRFDWPGYACDAPLGGFPAAPHASFYAEIYVRDDCVASFPGYRNSSHAQLSFNPGLLVRFANDITLGVPSCNLVAYEIAYKNNAILAIDLRTGLDPTDPERGGVIPGTAAFLLPHNLDVEIGRVEVDPPVLLPRSFFLGVKSATAGGPILTCRKADIGETTESYFVYNSGLAKWVPVPGTSWCWGGLDVTIYCEGSAPMGACCDMVLTNDRTCVGGPHQGNPCSRNTDCRVCVGGLNDGVACVNNTYCLDGECPESWVCVGESVCRELPEMNCPSSLGRLEGLWTEGARCGGVCAGGDDDGQACARQVDCPGGSCDGGPFAHPCGLSTCCEPDDDDTCENLTEKQCRSIEPVERARIYLRGSFCEAFNCPFNACLRRRGDCSIARSEPGCVNPFCCTDVCKFDPWCCRVEWDELCLRWLGEFCPWGPGNGRCDRPLEVDANGNAIVSNAYGTWDSNEVGFCCHNEDPGANGWGSMWFRFEATHTSARIHTCNTSEPSRDSLISVYHAIDSTTPQMACSTLDGIACSDDTPGCGDGLLSDVCVTHLVPGETYFVRLAGKTEDDLGIYHLDIESPCTPTVEPVPNYYCDFAETITQNVTPFDVAGASFDCPGPPSWCMQTMENDLWYDWTAPASGVATIQTCDGANTPDTGLVVYEGCECPVEDGRIVECNDFQRDPCFLGSKVTIPVVAGNCYKLRLGGHLGGTPSGDLQIDLQDTFEDCNRNGLPDACDIDCAAPEEDCQVPCGVSGDCNSNGKPDECEFGDPDRDEDVDLDDWALFTGCLTAPCGSPPCDPPLYAGIEESCCVADTEGDGDVDLDDVAGFQAAFTGP